MSSCFIAHIFAELLYSRNLFLLHSSSVCGMRGKKIQFVSRGIDMLVSTEIYKQIKIILEKKLTNIALCLEILGFHNINTVNGVRWVIIYFEVF